jgi:hypothetical protein
MQKPLRYHDMSAYWGGITDPAQHDPDAYFRYHVHSLNPADKGHGAFLLQRALDFGIGHVAGQSIDLSREPERITEAVTKSTSLIDKEHTTRTWTRGGLIIGVRPEDILITSHQDVGAIHGDRQKIIDIWGKRYPVRLSPDEILSRSGPDIQNEIIAAMLRVTILGFFVKDHELPGRISDPRMAKRLERHAQRLEVPFIRLPW